MNDRINSILKYYKTNSSKFAEEIGVQKSSISHVLSGRNKPSLDFIQKILKAFPEINSDWLILGKGKMIVGDEQNDLFQNPSIHFQEGIKTAKEEEIKEFPARQPKNPKVELDKELNKVIANPKAKKASKIVIFYLDNTFKEYLPEEF